MAASKDVSTCVSMCVSACVSTCVSMCVSTVSTHHSAQNSVSVNRESVRALPPMFWKSGWPRSFFNVYPLWESLGAL